MGDKITVKGDGLASLQTDMAALGAGIADVANGAYVAGNLFSQSHSNLADQMNDLCGVLSSAATQMYQLCESMASYFGKVIESMDQWDYDHAVAAYQAAHDLANQPQNE